jgi:flap endonuclease-1
MTSRLTREMVGRRASAALPGCRRQAPAEGEAQAAHMAQKPDVWAAASKDYDTLMFGAPASCAS